MNASKKKSSPKQRVTRSEKGTPESINTAKKAFSKGKTLPKQSRQITELPVQVIDQEAVKRAAFAFKESDRLTISKATKKLINFLNLIPPFILILTSIITKHKLATGAVLLFIKLYLDSAKKTEIENNKVVDITKLDTAEKKFFKEFASIFTEIYSKTDDIDKGLIALAFIDIIRNEIPRIIEKSKQINNVNNERIFSTILLNAKEIKTNYDAAKLKTA